MLQNLSEITDIFGKLKDVIIGQSRDLPDLSTSLYGIFVGNHIKYKIDTHYYIEDWDLISTIPNNLQENIDFTEVENRSYYTVNIGLLNNIVVNDSTGNPYAVCRIFHTPNNGNFWHFSINWFLVKEKKYWHSDVDNLQVTKDLKRTMRNLIKEYAMIASPLNISVSEIKYSNFDERQFI